MKNTSVLRDRIRKKFRKFSIFSKLAGIDRYTMEIEFLKKHEVDAEVYNKYQALYDSLNPEGHVVNTKLVEKINEAIELRGGLFKFAEESGISRHTIAQVIGGKYKSISPAVRKIIVALGILNSKK